MRVLNSLIQAQSKPTWIYCGDGDNLPEPFKAVVVLLKKPSVVSAHMYKIEYPAHYAKPLAPSGFSKEGWYIWEKRLQAKVVAWLYLPPEFAITLEDLNQLMTKKVLPL